MRVKSDLIGVDWGTSNLRVMRIKDGGDILEVRNDTRGASQLDARDFAKVLHDVAGDWIDNQASIMICGMAGARGKWRETGYRNCPAGLTDLVPVALGNSGPKIMIVPGVALEQQTVLKDVMRGEETQVMGLPTNADSRIVVTPGTYSKWIQVIDERILNFRTFMTGDLFAAIKERTILGEEMGNTGVDIHAFEDGVRRSLSEQAVVAVLFSVRTKRLSGQLPASSTADYLSGLLVGAEVAAQEPAPEASITLVGNPALNARYMAALDIAGWKNVRTADGPATTAKGLWHIYEAHCT